MASKDVASKYSVSRAWVDRLKQRRARDGETAPRQQATFRRRTLSADQEHRLIALITATPDATLVELRSALPTTAALSTLWRTIGRQERGGVDRAIEHRQRSQPLESERGDDRMRLPVRTRRLIAQPHAPGTRAVVTEQIRRDAGFIEKDERPRVVERLRVAPASTRRSDVSAPLFVGVYRFF